MRKSRVLKEVREGRVATMLKSNLHHPAVMELAGLAGFSAVWICNEHVPSDWSRLEHCIRAAKNFDTDTVVRISKGSYSEYLKPFEADAAAIMVPHVTSADEVKRIVDFCRCHPLGRRPMDGGNADGQYCQVPPEDYVRFCNEEKMIIVQIESPEAVEVVGEIAAVEGIDCVLFGPGDYSHRIGRYGQIHHPEVETARRKVEEAILEHGKFGCAVGVKASPEELLERGYGIAQVCGDVTTLGPAFRKAFEDFWASGTGPGKGY